MRLLKIGDAGDISLTADLLDNIPAYGILSHTWGSDHDECTFEDLRDGTGKSKIGYTKIQFCGQKARKDGLEYFWVDSCCINKSNHAELSEALNSMFRWYRGATKCYVYLSDVSAHKRDNEGQTHRTWEPGFRGSRWFTRGWTVQELLAPESVNFFSKEGELLGTKRTLDALIHEITGIPISALHGAALSSFSVDERMRWACKRNTKRTEDKVYSLLGIFDVFMVPIYGEGEYAWTRLKDEIGKSYRAHLDNTRQGDAMQQSYGSKDEASARRQELLTSLSFDQMDSRRATIKRAYSTTCEWFLKHSAYVAWINPNRFHEHHGFLWVNGKPGAGKSTLVKFAHGYADRVRSGDEIVVSFFFNARGDDLEKSTVGMYRSLLDQLFKKAVDLQEVLDDFHVPLITPGQNSAWTIESLRELLSLAVARLRSRRLKCFIDALDECDEQEVRDMIVSFEELGESARENGSQVYVFFASRHYPTIDIRSGCQLTLENETGHGEDLAKYVKSHLRAGTGKYVEEIKAHILEKANGVFMWAVLVVEILNKEFRTGRIFAVRNRLQEIPARLSDLFKDILERDHADISDLSLCLRWLLFARRPLKREEFYFAMVAGLDAEPENVAEWDPEYVTVEHMNLFVLNSSKGLAEVTKSKTPTVQFIHESVRDFLIKDNGFRYVCPEIGEDLSSTSHEHLKSCCQTYLKANTPISDPAYSTVEKATSDAAKSLRERVTLKLPFLEYAGRHLLYHADEAAKNIPQDSFLNDLHLGSLLNVTDMFERYDIRRHDSNTSLVYALAENNCARLIRIAAQEGYALNAEGNRYRFPLFAALAYGHKEALKALLQLDETSLSDNIVEHLEFGKAFLARKDQTPLLWALEKGHEALAEILETSADSAPHSTNREGRNALSLAAEKGYERLVRLLANRAADVDACGRNWRTPLSYAAEHGHLGVVQLLIERGAEASFCGDVLPSSLSYAAQSGHTEIVQLLLQKPRSKITLDGRYRYALSYAAEYGQVDVVQMLLKQASLREVKHVDLDHQTALSYAAKYGHVAVVQLLLERGDHPDDVGFLAHPAFHMAAAFNQRAAMQVLLASGADIDRIDDQGRSALIFAVENIVEGTEVQAVELLLEQGAESELVDPNGNTALLYAAVRGLEPVVRLLLDRGANIEAQNGKGWTALSCAIQNSQDRVVQLLIECSANIECRDSNGRTPLLMAAQLGRRKIVQTLVVLGANVEARDTAGRTPLSYASGIGDQYTVWRLIASNACVTTVDHEGRTALLWVLQQNGPFYERGPEGPGPHNYEMQLLLLEQQSRKRAELAPTIPGEQLSDDRKEVMRLLLDNGVQLDATGKDGKTAIRLAAKNGWENAISLIQKCCDGRGTTEHIH